MTESIAEGLSVVGLVVGFPLLLLLLMLSLEQLESWGLRGSDSDHHDDAELSDPISDAVEEVQQRTIADAEAEQAQSTASPTPR
ncbi:MAG: hypothetical protein KY460_09220 [Actinobacteria bacterium]|nr:hypothetical protein [Actinomycetota bacterium]